VVNDIDEQYKLIAPCGMNCSVCKAYLSYTRGLSKQRGHVIHCLGCRIRNKKCAFLKAHCKKLLKGEVNFCFECENFPCNRLKTLDKRYVTKYQTSLIENLNQIKNIGLPKWLQTEEEKWKCPRCGGTISIHDGKCYNCLKVKMA